MQVVLFNGGWCDEGYVVIVLRVRYTLDVTGDRGNPGLHADDARIFECPMSRRVDRGKADGKYGVRTGSTRLFVSHYGKPMYPL